MKKEGEEAAPSFGELTVLQVKKILKQCQDFVIETCGDAFLALSKCLWLVIIIKTNRYFLVFAEFAKSVLCFFFLFETFNAGLKLFECL